MRPSQRWSETHASIGLLYLWALDSLRSDLRNRIPFLFAALLVAALVAGVGVAAFSIGGSAEPAAEEPSYDGPISGRVASAVLAASVTAATAPTTTEAETSVPMTSVPPETSTTTSSPPTTAAESSAAPVTTDTTPPSLAITHPHDGDTVTTSVVEFMGTSEPGAVVTSGPFEADTRDNGDWSIRLVVDDGYNSTVFTATDAAGNEGSVRISVIYEPATTTTTTEAPPPASTTTKPPSTTTTAGPPPSDCPVPGSCSPNWPADPKASHGREYWRSTVEQYWPAERVECVLDLIQVESGGDPQARSPGGNYLGLLQHSYWGWNRRAEAIGLVDGNGLTAHPYNGAANIAAGAWLANNSSPWYKPWPPTGHIASCQALGAG